MTKHDDTPRRDQGETSIARQDKTSEPPNNGASEAARKVAIALEYKEGLDRAPRISATGKGAVAEQILEIAFATGVKVREDADLAQVLGALEVDSIVPTEALATVAEILSYVYRANRDALLQGMQP